MNTEDFEKACQIFENALIENYQIEAFMVALQSNEHHMVLEKVCV